MTIARRDRTQIARRCHRGPGRLVRRDADALPRRANATGRLRRGDGIIANVVEFEVPVVDILHQHVGLARVAAEVADPDKVPLRPNASHRSAADQRIVADVADLKRSFVGGQFCKPI